MATKAELRIRARTRADQDNSTFPTDTQYDLFITEAAKDTWYDLIHAGWPVNFTQVDLNPTSQTTALGVSGTVAFIRGVYRKDGGQFTELARIEEGQRAGLMSLAAGNQSSYYDVRTDPTSGPILELLPVPSGGVYRVEYILEYPGFASDSTAWIGPARSDELIVLGAATKGCLKEGQKEDAQILMAERTMLLDKVTSMASWFDMRNPPRVRDVRERDFRNQHRLPFDFDV